MHLIHHKLKKHYNSSNVWKLIIGFIIMMMFFVIIAQIIPSQDPFSRINYFSYLFSSLLAGTITILAADRYKKNNITSQELKERSGWILIGIGLLCWSMGELFWRYELSQHQNPFPSFADIGYSLMPIFVIIGLLIQPTIFYSRQERLFIFLDSCIAMGAILAMAWYLFLGPLFIYNYGHLLAKFIAIYYPAADVIVLGCLFMALLRGQRYRSQKPASQLCWFLLAIGIVGFLFSDIVFSFQQNDNIDKFDTLPTIGWSLGALIIGLATPLRYHILSVEKTNLSRNNALDSCNIAIFSPVRYIPYVFVTGSMIVLLLNIFSRSPQQMTIRPFLMCITFFVLIITIARQLITIKENERLTRSQAQSLAQLKEARQRLEEQTRLISERNEELKQGITHLKYVQANLANGHLRTRAHLSSGELLPLAASLNLMADRLMRLEHADQYTEDLTTTLDMICTALERSNMGKLFVLYPMYRQFAITKRLINALQAKQMYSDRYRSNALSSGPISSPNLQHQPVTEDHPIFNTDTPPALKRVSLKPLFSPSPEKLE